MSWTHKFIDHTADIAVDIMADNLNELFIASAFAWKSAICDQKIDAQNIEKKIILNEIDLEILLVSFLNELNYLFQFAEWLMSSIKSLQVVKRDEIWQLDAEVSGFTFDKSRIKLKSEIKAVTYHQMEIREKDGKYFTRIVFDI